MTADMNAALARAQKMVATPRMFKAENLNLAAALLELRAELTAYDAIINDDGSLTTHAEKLSILQDMAHAYKHSSDWEAQEEKLRVAQKERNAIVALLNSEVHETRAELEAAQGEIAALRKDVDRSMKNWE